MPSSRFLFWSLIVVVVVAGANQGLTLPLLAVLLEEQGVSSLANGLNAAAMYIGTLLLAPWWEIPLRKWGYRTLIVFGLVLLTVSTLLLPLLDGLVLWFMLRLVMGIGDSALHFASQIWITATSPTERRGRDISLYGLAYGIGFSIGPLGLNLLSLGRVAPFVALAVLYAVAFAMVFRLPNAYPRAVAASEDRKQGNRYLQVVRFAWLALIPSFLYGYMEASLNGSFPIYALRIGVSPEWLSLILPSFVVGSLFLQLPLGMISDRMGRKPVMMACALVGGSAFCLFPLLGPNPGLMMLLLAVAGAAVGSFYSLGLAFAADLLPLGLIPTAGAIAGVNFGLGSIIGPYLNGYMIDHIAPQMMFWLLGGLMFCFALACLGFRDRQAAGSQPAGKERHRLVVDGKN